MGVLVLTDCFVSLNTVDISNRVTAVNLDTNKALPDATTMGDEWQGAVQGLKVWEMSLEVLSDYAASQLDSMLWGIFDGGTECDLIVRPTSDAVGTNNPQFTMTGYLENYSPIAGGVGEVAKQTITFKPKKGEAGVARTTS